ncbi:tRNA glutamyl-Q(34) synthetase GluQRS [Litoreibacter roseus]|uniref:tRNA glutamyl-Q synthetase n=1 Tax=Litoreibacter roseus TaxID=2601869 RepID=A0A6N6JKF7_9RHOB|nr:tRNA glutamyl-Q(34) synthetase GluQRS [Litoreibacter roseus]GFE66634.1 tRNA glutamyl-Q synthetase [Litoreibacter roseus]
MTFRTRFAPSPTGPLHLGHAYSALLAYDMATDAGGTFLLRIEDTDTSRCRPEWESQIFDDLAWLGLKWDMPVLRQSENGPRYNAALSELATLGLVYPCSCRRADIRDALGAPQEGVHATGPDGLIYPGTCRKRSMADAAPTDAVRLDMKKTSELIDRDLFFKETGSGEIMDRMVDLGTMIETVGDVVLHRRDIGTAAYHLASVVDDAAQDITHVVRGEDLFDATQIHVVLQALLGFPTPIYHHHRLIRDDAGKRLAKRDDAKAIATYRAAGFTPADLRDLVGLA